MGSVRRGGDNWGLAQLTPKSPATHTRTKQETPSQYLQQARLVPLGLTQRGRQGLGVQRRPQICHP
jgi:hypothetical protein